MQAGTPLRVSRRGASAWPSASACQIMPSYQPVTRAQLARPRCRLLALCHLILLVPQGPSPEPLDLLPGLCSHDYDRLAEHPDRLGWVA